MTALRCRLRRPQGNNEAEALWPLVVYLLGTGVALGRGGFRMDRAFGVRSWGTNGNRIG
jgi:hypothetical protein